GIKSLGVGCGFIAGRQVEVDERQASAGNQRVALILHCARNAATGRRPERSALDNKAAKQEYAKGDPKAGCHPESGSLVKGGLAAPLNPSTHLSHGSSICHEEIDASCA